MQNTAKSIWLVTREYAGIAEAGGVKNVACSLSEGLAALGKSVTVFMPRYGCVGTESSFLFSGALEVAGETEYVSFGEYAHHGVRIVLIECERFREKRAVYVYTEEESRSVPGAARGKGHHDVDLMNMILQKAVMRFAIETGSAPDVLHCQDAHTALLPALVRNDPDSAILFSRTECVVTIHNAGPGYRQAIPSIDRAALLTGLAEGVLSKGLFNGNVEPFLLAAEYGKLTTVSPWYASELTSGRFDSFSEGLSGEFERRGTRIVGITNGIDYHRYSPADTSVSLLPFPFDPASGNLAGKYETRERFIAMIRNFTDSPEMHCFGTIDPVGDAVYFSYHGRIAWQKGLDTFEKTARIVLDAIPEARFIILGQGDPHLESLFIRLSMRYPGRFAFIRGYERSLARMAVAVADFLVLPSVFEPCGLEDYIGQIFGTIPVAHAVGGLQKIRHGVNGFLYSSDSDNEAVVLADLLVRLARPVIESGGIGCDAVSEYRAMIRLAAETVRDSCDWNTIILDHYLPLYDA